MTAALVFLAVVVGYVLVVLLLAAAVRRRIHTRPGIPAEHRADRWE